MSTETPHDRLFRCAFGQPAVAADHFRATLARRWSRPFAGTRSSCWDTLELLPATFVDENLRACTATCCTGRSSTAGSSSGCTCCSSTKSTPDPRMPWRLLRYMVRIWDQTDADRPLPCIVPLVLYNGQRPWTVPMDFHGMVAVPETVAADVLGGVPEFRYGLTDLSRTDDVGWCCS